MNSKQNAEKFLYPLKCIPIRVDFSNLFPSTLLSTYILYRFFSDPRSNDLTSAMFEWRVAPHANTRLNIPWFRIDRKKTAIKKKKIEVGFRSNMENFLNKNESHEISHS